jgi:hypothetical protein
MTNFWLEFIVSEALAVAEAFVGLSTIPVPLKNALTQFIAAGEAVITEL